MAPIEVVLVGVAVFATGLSIIASMRVMAQRENALRLLAQLVFVWVVPIVGALVALQMLRKEPERSPNPYETGPTDFESGDRINQHDANS